MKYQTQYTNIKHTLKKEPIFTICVGYEGKYFGQGEGGGVEAVYESRRIDAVYFAES